jgi:protein O-GlcNAc transferase
MVATRDPAAVIQDGLAAHQTGQLDLAEARYREALRLLPDQPDALHLLGVVTFQTGRLAEAETLIRRALTLSTEQPTFWNSLGVVQQGQGRVADAAKSFEQAVTLAPDYVDGWGNLTAMCMALGDSAGEAAALVQLTTLMPQHARAWGRRGILASNEGQLDEAVALLERATALAPDDAEALSSLGTIQVQLGQGVEAEANQRRALTLRPDDPAIVNNLASALLVQSRWQESADLLAQVIERAPDDPNGWTNLGHALKGLERRAEAIEAYERALSLRPDDPKALLGLADTLQGLRRLDEAVTYYERTLAAKPDYVEAHEHLGIALQTLGRLPEAIEAYRRSLEFAPDRPAVHSAIIFTLDLLEGHEAEATVERARWNTRFGQAAGSQLALLNDRRPNRLLRVGYVSADFRSHSAGFIALPIIQSHDRTRVQVFCYSGVTTPDEVTARFQEATDLWRDVAETSDDDLTALIRADQIDVLVDLSGHSAGNRLPVFARKPAPVQITAWGYATGTGLDAMGYFLADPIVVPVEGHSAYTEEVVNLPNVVCYGPPPAFPDVTPPPMLSRGHITFGSFNRLAKVTPGAVAAWARVLTALPTAHLIVKSGSQDPESARQRLIDDLAALGVSRDRVEVRRGTSQYDHLAAHADVDLMLDPFPHGGGITTLEAMLMGVPTVTLLGERVAGRLSASFLAVLGLEQLVAKTLDEYVALAVDVATSAEWLASERASLRERLLASPIGDARRYTQAVEDTYLELWQRWCSEESGVSSQESVGPGHKSSANSRLRASARSRKRRG